MHLSRGIFTLRSPIFIDLINKMEITAAFKLEIACNTSRACSLPRQLVGSVRRLLTLAYPWRWGTAQGVQISSAKGGGPKDWKMVPQVWSDRGKILCGASFWRLNNWEDERHKFYSASEAGTGDSERLQKL